jgi:4-carboxymuconolactone decarboxylase
MSRIIHEDGAAMNQIGPDRLPPIPEDRQTPAQRRAAAELAAGLRGGLRGPFIPMLRSPELLDRTQHLGEYLRYRGVVPHKLRELAILVTARHWGASYEWYAHAPIARKAGLAPTLIEALAVDREPTGLEADEETVLRFCRELHQSHAVNDSVYARALALFGEDGVVELTALCGYYALLAMVLNVARTPTPQP